MSSLRTTTCDALIVPSGYIACFPVFFKDSFTPFDLCQNNITLTKRGKTLNKRIWHHHQVLTFNQSHLFLLYLEVHEKEGCRYEADDEGSQDHGVDELQQTDEQQRQQVHKQHQPHLTHILTVSRQCLPHMHNTTLWQSMCAHK